MTRAEIMEATNMLIENLMLCDDAGFVNRVGLAVMYGLEFTDAEIEGEK